MRPGWAPTCWWSSWPWKKFSAYCDGRWSLFLLVHQRSRIRVWVWAASTTDVDATIDWQGGSAVERHCLQVAAETQQTQDWGQRLPTTKSTAKVWSVLYNNNQMHRFWQNQTSWSCQRCCQVRCKTEENMPATVHSHEWRCFEIVSNYRVREALVVEAAAA